MLNVVCKIAPTPVLPASRTRGVKRTVHLQNQSAEVITLQFDGQTQPAGQVLAPGFGYQLAAGATKILSPTSPGGEDGSQPIMACSASGSAVLHVQSIEYTKTVQ